MRTPLISVKESANPADAIMRRIDRYHADPRVNKQRGGDSCPDSGSALTSQSGVSSCQQVAFAAEISLAATLLSHTAGTSRSGQLTRIYRQVESLTINNKSDRLDSVVLLYQNSTLIVSALWAHRMGWRRRMALRAIRDLQRLYGIVTLAFTAS